MAITYRGTTLPFAKHDDDGPDRVRKDIAFPGVDGTEVMHFGKRQRSFRINGRIVDIQAGAFKKETIEAWNDTTVGDLVIHGRTFENVMMLSPSFSNCYKDAVSGKIGCEYNLEFRKLR